MTNEESTVSAAPETGGRGRKRHRTFMLAGAATALSALGIGVFASPAFAHTNDVSGVVSCANSVYTITWTIDNTYNGPETATVSSVTDGTATLSQTQFPIAANSSATITQTLPATDTGTITLGIIGSWVGFTSPTPDTGSVTLSGGCVAPDVTVTKSIASPATPVTLPMGSTTPVVYDLTVTNESATDATTAGVTVDDAVPAGTTYVAGSATCVTGGSVSCSPGESGGTVSYDIGDGIAPNGTYVVSFAVTLDPTTGAGTISNTGSWRGPGCDSDLACPTNIVTFTVTSTSVTVSKSDSDGSNAVNPGDVITYTLAAENGPGAPASLTVTDAAPAQTTLTTPAPACPSGTSSTCSVAVSGSSITWTITDMPAGATYDLTFAVKVDGSATGTITNTGSYAGPGCTTAGGCATNTTHNPVTPPTSSGSPTTTVAPAPTTTAGPSPSTPTTVTPSQPTTAVAGATTVHTGEPWAGSKPYVIGVFLLGMSLFGYGSVLGFGQMRRRRASKVRIG